jgi:hypothetical protein
MDSHLMTDIRPHKIHGIYLPVELRKLVLCIHLSTTDPAELYAKLRARDIDPILANVLCVWSKRRDLFTDNLDGFQFP